MTLRAREPHARRWTKEDMNTADLTFEHGVLVGFGALAGLLIFLYILRPWRRALFSGAPISLATIIGMRLRSNPPNFLIDAYLELIKGGIVIPIDHIECVFMKYRSKINTPHDLAELSKELHENIKTNTGSGGGDNPP